MAVEPSDGNGEATENNLMREELPCIVDVEPIEGGLVQPRERPFQLLGQRIVLGHIHVGGQANAYQSGNDTCTGDSPVDLDVKALAVGAYKVAKRNKSSHARDDS